MSRRDAGAAGQQARHAKDRLQSTLGGGRRGLLVDGPDPEGFEYQGPGQPDEPGAGGKNGAAPLLRWRVGLHVAALLAVLAVAAGAWFWWQAGAGAPEILPLSGVSSGGNPGTPEGGAGGAAERRPESSSDSSRTQGDSVSGGLVVVHVAGAVGRPGIIRLQQGSRVDDAIAAAGGPAPDADLNRLNLALVIEDGQKIHVPRVGEPVDAGSGAGGGGGPGSETTGEAAGPGASGGKINLNTAGVAELDTLPKVGPVLAQRIVDWRKEHGPFKSVEELDAVDGVGPKMLESLLPLVTV
jgi:competence protein ComEA